MKDEVKGPLLRVQYSSRKRFRVLTSLIFLGAAATLSTFLPTPWSILHHKGTLNLPLHFKSTSAEEWRDDTWPIREQTAWDISTDFPHPRVLEYDVEEGTWLRLDVHPKTGDIVFDMIGDLYCISGKDAFTSVASGSIVQAHPVTLGVPHDSDPHFSPEGDRIVFRSDAGLGVDNIWVIQWKGCDEMNLRPYSSDTSSEVLREALSFKLEDEELLRQGIRETPMRKRNRLIREGREGAIMVTNETFRYVTDARFHPSGEKVIATKWYTSGRSLGAGEGWEYPVPSLDSASRKPTSVTAGSGSRVVGRTLPTGWTPQDYGEVQIGPEQIIWNNVDGIIYSKNVGDQWQFEYSKDVHKGIYAIFSMNLTTGVTETLVDSSPGGASRPELSHDGRTLAFVRRSRDHEVLALKDLETGTLVYAWDGLTYDLSGIAAPMGTYPSFAFTPADQGIVIWAAGKIHHVPLTTNSRGERVPSGSPTEIKFKAHIEKHIAETLSIENVVDLVGIETQDTQRVRAFRNLKVDESGNKVVFKAGNVPVVQVPGENAYTKVPVLYDDDGVTPYYAPSFVPGTDGNLVIQSRWSDVEFTKFEVADLVHGEAWEVQGVPLGRYLAPTISVGKGSKRSIAFVKTGGDYLSGDVVATAGAGLYVGDIDLDLLATTAEKKKITVTNLRFVPSEIALWDTIDLKFLEKNVKLLVQQSGRAFIIDLAGEPVNIQGKPPHYTLASGKASTQISVNPRPVSSAKAILNKLLHGGKSHSGYVAENIAFVDYFHVYVVPGRELKEGEEVWSRPGNATKGLARVSWDGGHDIAWSGDGKKIFWFLGPYLHSLEIDKLNQCSSSIKSDRSTFGIDCVHAFVKYQEIKVEHSTDIARLKKEATSIVSASEESNADVLVVYNATAVTMETGNLDSDLVYDAVIVLRGGVIESVTSTSAFDVSAMEGATVLNAQGGFVIPGFIDAHAHWNGFANSHPAKSWEMQTFLSYGVTTLHNPSSDTVDGYVERSRLESGQFIGPRIFHTGDVIYGAGAPDIHQDIIDMDEAFSALTRIRAEGGPISTSYKNYNLPIRASRQRLLLAARNMSMLCVPEGGMNYDWDLTYIIDGMTTVEHSIPVPVQYDDVLTLFALSGTANTPTHLVNYGGAFGEQYIWAVEDVPNNPKLQRFTRHDILEGVTESTARPKLSYQFFNTSASNAKMVPKGLKTLVGAHGEPPLGLNYHYEIFFTQQGGLSNYQALQSASSWAAQVLGLFPSLGSLSEGKLADLLIYPPGVDLLSGSIKKTLELRYVVRGGRIWEAESMEEVWPVKGRTQLMPPLNP